MFTPNRKCRARISDGQTDLYGQPVPGLWTTEGCSVVRMIITNEKTSVRADSSASRGNAMELLADLKILMTTKTLVNIDDILELDGYQFRVLGREPRRDVLGRLDHIEVSANIWSQL